jgi:hypothetical protein
MTWTGRAVVVAALPVAATLAVWPSGLSPFGPVKWLAVTTLVFAGLAAVLWRRADVLLARAPMWAWAAFLVLVIIAAGFGLDRVYAWTGTPERHFGVLAWFLCAGAFVTGQALDATEGRFVAAAGAIAASMFGLWAVAEALGWRPLDLVDAGSRPVATFGSSAYLGAAVALLGPVALALALEPEFARAWRIAAAVGAADERGRARRIGRAGRLGRRSHRAGRRAVPATTASARASARCRRAGRRVRDRCTSRACDWRGWARARRRA